jgi:WD40 repeat protein
LFSIRPGFWSLPGGELIRSIPGFTFLTQLYMCDEGRRLVVAAQPWTSPVRRIAWYSLVPPLGEVTDHGWTAGSRPVPDVEPGGSWVVVPVGEEVWRLPLENVGTAQPEIVARSDTLLGWGGAALDPEGRLLAAADEAGLVSLWSLESRSASPIQARKLLPATAIMRFDASGSRLAVLGDAGKGGYCTAIWDLAGPPDADALWISPDVAQTDDASFHPGGKWIAVDQDYTGSQGMVWYLDHPYVRVLRGQLSHAIDVSFTPDGSMLVSCEYTAGAVHVWPLTPESGAGRRTIFRTSWQLPPDAEGKSLADIAVDPKQRFVIAAGLGVFQIPLDGGDVRTLSGFTVVHAIDIDSKGRYLAATGGLFREREAHIRIWDLESDLTFVLDAGDSVVTYGLAFDPDGGLWATGDFGLRHWNLEKKAFELMREDPSGAVAVSNDGKRLLVAARKGVFLGNLDSGEWEELPIDGNSVAFAPSGNAVLVGNQEGVQVLSLSGGEPHLLLDRERSALSMGENLAFSPDGKWIATGDESGAIRLWPAPDLSKPPMETLPHDQLLARLKALTNIRMVPDEESDTGYTLDIDPFPGWEESPDR